MLKRLREFDIEAAAGLVAAVAALVLHLLHVADEAVLLAVILVILALVLIRDLRREAREERQTEALAEALSTLYDLRAAVTTPDTLLVGPSEIREVSSRFAERARGEMVWFNVCLAMFEPQGLFDALLRPAIDNPRVTSIQFVLDESERERWATAVVPKALACDEAGKLQEPRWAELQETVSLIVAEAEGARVEALLSFWGEPFMARTAAQDVPRYIFHVQHQSELIPRLRELERSYRLGRS